MNWHQLIDDRNNEMDRVVASVLKQDPDKLVLVVRWIEQRLADQEYSTQLKDELRVWLDLIQDRGLPGVLEALTDRSEKSTHLRQSSPFAVIMPQDERQRILRRYEALRPRAHPSGV